MLTTTNRKNKINLGDYPYKKDIANRLFLTELSPIEVDVLQELLFQPSKCRIGDLQDCIDHDTASLLAALDTFGRIGLTMQQQDTLFINKDLRKYFEVHIVKFADNFEPSFESLQGLFNKVPISVLPVWYSIPRTSDNIFESIVEKYLHTPKVYESYLQELTFDDPILNKIVEDVFESPDLKVEANILRQRYKLTREKLQEYLLILEFNFVLVSGFQDGIEVLCAFAEWQEYVKFQKRHQLKPLAETEVTVTKPAIKVTSREEQEDAMKRFRRTIDAWHTRWNDSIGLIEKSVFEIERTLRSVPNNSWVLLEDFLAGFITPIGYQPQVTLQRIGKKWRYSLPSYNSEEKAFIEGVVFDLLHDVGITTTGTFKNKPCFMITPFGRVALGDA